VLLVQLRKVLVVVMEALTKETLAVAVALGALVPTALAVQAVLVVPE
jgi:hypothetical protein